MTEPESGAEAAPSFVRSLRSAATAVTSALHTRLELFVTELEEERERFKQALALTLLLFFGIGLGFILLNIFVIALFWQAGWIYAIGGLALLYLAVGIAAGLSLRKKFCTRPRLFLATLGELGKDRD